MDLIIISFVLISKLAYKYRLCLWIYVRNSPLWFIGLRILDKVI